MSQFATKYVEGPTPAVRIAGVEKSFGRRAKAVTALTGIDLTIVPGECVALLGPRGSGRSTLLRLIADLESPTSGTIEVFGRAPGEARLDQDCGIVLEDPGLLPWRTVLQQIALPLELQGVPYAERAERAEELTLLVGLGDVRDQRPHQLTGDQPQRVAIGRALAQRPRLLLMDAPFAALDEPTRERLQQEFARLVAQSGAAVVIATDSIPEAVFLADRVVVLSSRPGRIVDIIEVPLGTARPEALRASPEFFERATAVRHALHGGRQSGEGAS